MKAIKFYITVQSSHAAANADYSGSDTTILEDGTFFIDANFFGHEVISAQITATGREKYEVSIDFANPITVSEATNFVKSFASFLTYKLSNAQNHFYGSPYVDVDYSDFYRDNGDGIRDHLKLELTRRFPLADLPNVIPELNELVHFYFLGMQSNNIKAKYFNLFLILESVEESTFAKTMFPNATLFTENEISLLRTTANQMENDRKKSTVLAILRRTDEPRHAKLYLVLQALGLTHCRALDQTQIPITTATIKELVDARNKLFHTGNTINGNIIWEKLIPITREIIALLLENPMVLTSDFSRAT